MGELGSRTQNQGSQVCFPIPHNITKHEYVGDFGEINKIIGVLVKKGNIYDDTHVYIDENALKLLRNNPPISAPQDDQYIATSSNVKKSDLELDPHV